MFCGGCGSSLELEVICPHCGSKPPKGFNFCNKCGHDLKESKKTIPLPASKLPPPLNDKALSTTSEFESERKNVTVLFSDMSGYTAMSERLDPEDVKEITSRIFDEISKIVGNYDGFIEKFAGDAVMAMFGATTSHEDDPVRAIRAAMEIHNVVNQLSPQYEEIIEQPLSMHTGINTGLVVTGDINLEKGTHGVAGDTLNVAARLSSIGNADDIMVGPDTFCQTEGFFNFKSLKPTKVKGKAKPVQIYKVLSLKEHPRKVHRLQGVRSELIGRTAEMRQLKNAVERLKQGQGTVISVCGAAGTGKSRLIEEFKASMDLKEIQWRKGHAYPYTQDISYAPFIDIMNRAFRIKEGDSPDTIKEKVEKDIEYLVDKKEDIVPYVGSLYDLKYPEIEGISPEFWKSELQKAIQDIVLGLTRKGPTIFCFEDLQWADPSSIDLLHYLLSNFRYPALFLCVYRPTFSLFTSHQVSSIGKVYEEIQLLGLSPTEVHNMVESLLKTRSISFELKGFVQKKVEGNPFFLEEVINSLIESETLMRDNGTWKLIKPITESEVPATIHGVLSARFDRLENEKKRVLQEASVIGRAFFYDILKKITDISDQCDQCINALERLDLVRAKSFQPDLEYIFKHALTQEVVYNGLLKKERRILHEKIGLVMEQLFQDRLSEFYETLAFHFSRGSSTGKAVKYLIKSGEKNLSRYSELEAHVHFQEAFEVLSTKSDKTLSDNLVLIDLLNNWGYAYYYKGNFKEMLKLFRNYEDLAKSIGDDARYGMFCAWFGITYYMSGLIDAAYKYLKKSILLGEKSGDHKVIGYACTWLAWTCAYLGQPKEGISYGERALKISIQFPSDQYLYFKPLAGICNCHYFLGNANELIKGGQSLIEYGIKNANNRSLTMGYWTIAWGQMARGDMQLVIDNAEKAISVAQDPFYGQFPNMALGPAHVLRGEIAEAKKVLTDAIAFTEKNGVGIIGIFCKGFFGVALVAEGQMALGMKMIEKTYSNLLKYNHKGMLPLFEYVLGYVYYQIAYGPKPSLSVMVKNAFFLVKHAPFASRKAIQHFKKAIDLAKETSAKCFIGQAYLGLGLIYMNWKKNSAAAENLNLAIREFKKCEADVFLDQAMEALDLVNSN